MTGTGANSFGSLTDVQFASARAIVARALQEFLPTEKIDVADYAAVHRYLNNRGGGYVGRWSHDEAPYLVGPMRSLTSRTHLTTAIVGPGRSGKTTVGQNWMLQAVGNDPADMLVYGATESMIETYVKAEIEPMIDGHPVLEQALGKRPKDRSMAFKNFRSMWVQFLVASYNNLINKSAGRVLITELDACDTSAGDPYELADIRRQSFGYESMVLAESHPDLAAGLDPAKWTAGIMRLYADSDRRIWYWPCPHCNGFSSPNPTGRWITTLDWPEDAPPDEIRDAARMTCPHCGALIEDRWRRPMNKDGVWVGTGQQISVEGDIAGDLIETDIAGFWITGLMSPFVIGGIGGLARAMAQARQAVERGDDDAEQKLKDVTVKRWGIPFDPPQKVGVMDGATLAQRAEPALTLGTVPDGVRFLTFSADIQAGYFQFLVRGWGVGAESWVIDWKRIQADPETSPADWDDLLKRIRTHLYPLADGSGRGMRIYAGGYDSGGQDGVTLQAYNAWLRGRARGDVRFAGTIDGRDAWSILPLKGASGPNAPSLVVNYPDGARSDRKAAARGEIPVGLFNPNRYKDDLAVQLARAEPGANAVHFPTGLLAEQPPHPFFEQLVAEQRGPGGKWVKVARRNEALDLMVMAHVMANLHGLRRMNWDAPPRWAAPWDTNPMVQSMPTPAEQLVEALKSVTAAVIGTSVVAPTETVAERMARLAKAHGSGKF